MRARRGRARDTLFYGEMDMKTQMKFQKIFMLVSLIVAALSIVLALVFVSGSLFEISRLYDASAKVEASYTYITGNPFQGNFEEHTVIALGSEKIFNIVNNVSDLLLTLGIVMVLCVVFNYVTATNKRRNYYITNYISIGVVIAFSVALAITIIALCANCQSVVLNTDYSAGIQGVYNYLYPNKEFSYTNIWSVYFGYAVAALLLAVAAGYALNLVWKIKLMQGEKALLRGGLVKEVA